MSTENCCDHEIEQLKEDFMDLAIEVKSLKETYRKCLIENLEKDLVIRELKTKLASKKFSEFEEKLSTPTMNVLRSIGNSQSEDSKFVYVALE